VLASVPAASPPASTTCCTSRRPWRWWAGSARYCWSGARTSSSGRAPLMRRFPGTGPCSDL